MLAGSDLIAFAPTTDLQTARSFYAERLGLQLVHESAYAYVFDAHGTMLRVTLVGDVAHPGYTVLGWRVTNISNTIARLASVGVVFSRHAGMEQDVHGVWTSPSGDRIAWFADPGGNVLSLTQFTLTMSCPPRRQTRPAPRASAPAADRAASGEPVGA